MEITQVRVGDVIKFRDQNSLIREAWKVLKVHEQTSKALHQTWFCHAQCLEAYGKSRIGSIINFNFSSDFWFIERELTPIKIKIKDLI